MSMSMSMLNCILRCVVRVCCGIVARLRVTYPLLFEVVNPMVPALRTHCGVMEFSAEEGVAYLPLWVGTSIASFPI
jgi:hypothetical protein